MNDSDVPATAPPEPGLGKTPPPPPSPAHGRPPLLQFVLMGLALVLVTVVLLGMYWSRQPTALEVAEIQQRELEAIGAQAMPGSAVVASAIFVGETLLSKPGGLLYNDVTPPGLYLDNMPNWEYGVLKELRDSVRALRNDFSRSQTQSIENEHVRRADLRFAIDVGSWILPAAEDEYRSGVEELRGFLADLSAFAGSGASFYARADNLAAYLAVVEKRLGSFAVQLAGSVGDSELTASLLAAQQADGEGANVGGVTLRAAPASQLERTAWNQIDDVFYQARGYSWALLHMMQGIAIDFKDVLVAKNAEVSLQQVIRDLEGATRSMISPIVLNGHGYGFLANHSLVMASYISRANAAVLDLRILLQQG